jgi:uncharacterized membrane protein
LANVIALRLRWDPYPFILLNLAFSTQAAYAAPLILLAATRQADRDKTQAEDNRRMADAQRRHVEEQSRGLSSLLQANIELTQRAAELTAEIHANDLRAAARARTDGPFVTPGRQRTR